MDRNRQLRSDALRLAFLMGLCSAIGIYLILTTVLISKDGVFYIEQARRIAVDPVGVCRRYPPGYPFLLWMSHGVASLFAEGDSPMLWAYSAQAITLLCRVLTLVPLYLLGRLVVGPTNSFWALFVLTILPYPAYYGSDALREWPHMLFLSTGLLLLYWSLMTRRWWVLALVGLDAGLGYLIRPECSQLILYAGLGLLVTLESPRETEHETRNARRMTHDAQRLGAGLLLIAGFAIPAIPYVRASGSILPQQLRPFTSNQPPVLETIGPKAAANAPLEFEVRVGELLEVPIRAVDPDGDSLAFSLVGVPLRSRPVYLFRMTSAGAEFWTISEDEKDRLLALDSEIWDYEGISWYAYADPDARPGLRPVHRFWSAARERHFFTMDESEKDAVVAGSTADPWTYEGVAFYVFAEGNHPADTSAIHRPRAEGQAYPRVTNPTSETTAQGEAVAWYAHPAGEPPAGARIEGGVFRWRPGPGQRGEHQMNIVVTDGSLSRCQLVVVHVVGAASAGRERLRREEPSAYALSRRLTEKSMGSPSRSVATGAPRRGPYSSTRFLGSLSLKNGESEASGARPGFEREESKREILLSPSRPDVPSSVSGTIPGSMAGLLAPRGWVLSSALHRGDLRSSLEAVDRIVGGIGEELMVIPLLPWILGLFCHLKYFAKRLERVLIPAVLIVTIGLMFGRYVFLAPDWDRRYALATVVLTIFYIPAGLDVMTRVLNRIYTFKGRLAVFGAERRPPWFYILILGGIVLCTPKLIFRPLRAEKAGYLAAAKWLHRNTAAEAMIAVPDPRITFYADRRGFFYRSYLDSRRADYVVEIVGDDAGQPPEGWTREYSTDVGPGVNKTVIIYSTPRAKR